VKKIGNIQSPLLKIILCIITFSVLLILFKLEAYSNEVKVAAVITPRHIQLNEKAILELTISGNTLINNIGAPKFNFLPDFLTVPLQTNTTPRLVEDKIAVTMAWVYELIPQKIGEIVLSDISFTYQGVPYIANPGKIVVGAADTYHHPSSGGIHKVDATVSNKNPYVNEAIEYRFRYLYTTVLPTEASTTTSLPKFQDFVVDELLSEKTSTVKLNGDTFYVQETLIRIYPQNTGKILIQPSELELPIKGRPKILKTDPIPLNVEPIPELGRPPHFNGAVGNYSITAQVDRMKLEVRKALTLTLNISGTGNFKTVNPPKLSSLNGFRVDPPNQVKTDTSDSSIYTYVIIPLRAGILQIPALQYAYFNPHTKDFHTTNTTPIPITVLPNHTDVEEINSDTIPWLVWLILISLFALLVMGGYLLYSLKFKSHNGNPPQNAATRLDQGNPILERLDSLENVTGTASLGEEISKLINQYLCDLQNEPYRKLNTTEIQGICQHYSISLQIVDDIIDILKKCDHLRFAPVPLSGEERNALITRTASVIQHIDESMSTR